MFPTLPAGYTSRPGAPEDIPELSRLDADYCTRLFGRTGEARESGDTPHLSAQVAMCPRAPSSSAANGGKNLSSLRYLFTINRRS